MGKKQPLISVIIPAYNNGEYIKECLDSVFAQNGAGSLFELEVIVVDDGSTDETSKVVSQFGERVHYKCIPNSGRPSVPRNTGVQMADGEYLAFLDADDVWLPNKLQLQLKQFDDDPRLALASANARRVNEAGKDLNKLVVVDKLLPPKIDFIHLTRLNFICTSATLVKSSVFRNLGGFNESIQLRAVEDYELWMRIAAIYPIAYDHTPLILYRVHAGATSKHSDKVGWSLTLNAYRSVKKKVGKSLSRSDRRGVDQQIMNAQHIIASLSGPLGKVRYRLAYFYTRLCLRIESTRI